MDTFAFSSPMLLQTTCQKNYNQAENNGELMMDSITIVQNYNQD